MKRARGWAFTINNYTDDDVDMLLDMTFEYMIIGFEVGKDGTPHIQGYVYWHDAHTFRAVKNTIPRAHLETANGTPKQNREYCAEDGDFYEFGVLPRKGKRTDLDDLVEAIEKGASRTEIREQFPKHYFMYKKRIEELVPVRNEPGQRQVKLLCIDDQYRHAGAFLAHYGLDFETYMSEEIVVLYTQYGFNVESWFAGFPARVRRGYEVTIIDPKIVYFIYRTEAEYDFFLNKYHHMIDHDDVENLFWGQDTQEEEGEEIKAQVPGRQGSRPKNS